MRSIDRQLGMALEDTAQRAVAPRAVTPAVAAGNGNGRQRSRPVAPPPVPVVRAQYTPLGLQVREYGYRSARTVRGDGRTVLQPGHPDMHLRYDLDTLRKASQCYFRDNGIYKATIRRVVDVMIGGGITLRARTRNKDVNRRLESLWREWWQSPEIRGMDDGDNFARMVMEQVFVDGDLGFIKDEATGRLQLIDGERITSTKTTRGSHRVEQGVEVDRLGRPVAYHVANYDSTGFVQHNSIPIAAEDFIFLAARERVTQTRGAPVQACNFPMFHRINDVCDSEAIAWQVLSKLAVAITRKDAAALAAETATEDSTAGDANVAQYYHDIGDAIIFHGELGDEIKGIDRNIPGSTFSDSIKMFMRLLGLPLGLSLEFMLLIWSDTNYSSGRASVKQVQRACKPWFKLLWSAMRNIYAWKVGQWIDAGRLSRRTDILDHEFHAEPYWLLDPHKEEDARSKRFANRVTSVTREVKDTGDDYADLLAEQMRELEQAADDVAAFNAKYPDVNLTVRDVVPWLAQGKTQTPAASGRPAQPEDEPPPENRPDEEGNRGS